MQRVSVTDHRFHGGSGSWRQFYSSALCLLCGRRCDEIIACTTRVDPANSREGHWANGKENVESGTKHIIAAYASANATDGEVLRPHR